MTQATERAAVNDMHDSNLQIRQVTLSSENIKEEKFHVLGFVPANFVGLRNEIWFVKLTYEQIDSMEEFLLYVALNFNPKPKPKLLLLNHIITNNLTILLTI
jgi:hypothetical protein